MLRMLRYLRSEESKSLSSELSYTSSEMAFYHQMAESSNLNLQR